MAIPHLLIGKRSAANQTCSNPTCGRKTKATHANGRCSSCFDFDQYAATAIKSPKYGNPSKRNASYYEKNAKHINEQQQRARAKARTV
jgi:hypothetical protein